MTSFSSSALDPGVHQLLGFHGVRARPPRGGDGGGGCHDRCHQPQTPKSGLPGGRNRRPDHCPPARWALDEDAHRQLHLVHHLRVAHFVSSGWR